MKNYELFDTVRIMNSWVDDDDMEVTEVVEATIFLGSTTNDLFALQAMYPPLSVFALPGAIVPSAERSS